MKPLLLTLGLLLLGLSVSAQPLTMNDPVFGDTAGTGGGGWTPESESDLMYYWVSSDLSDGSVASWTDRKAGVVVSQTEPSLQPTASSTGVLFNGVDVELTNHTQTIFAGGGGSAITFWMLISKSDYGEVARKQIMTQYPGAVNDKFWLENTFYGLGSVSLGKNGGGTGLRDFSFTDDSATTGKAYTNNVQTSGGANMSSWGTGLTFGNGYLGNYALGGYVTEIAIFTNVQSSIVLSNLHHYATNRYSFSP